MKPLSEQPQATAWSKFRYYGRSLVTLVRGIRSPVAVLKLAAGRPARVTLVGGLTFYTRSLMDLWIIKETCLDGDYESFGVTVENGWTVVDIGAGLGDFAVSVGRRLPDCRILAYEPFTESYGLLLENIELNGVRGVVPVSAAVAGRSGHLFLAETGAAVQHTTQLIAAGRAPRQRVPAVTLAEIMDSHQLARVDFLKIDCEGGEFDILLDAEPDLFQRIHHICLEYHDLATHHHHQELVDHLSALGFEIRVRSNPVHADLGLLFARRSPG